MPSIYGTATREKWQPENANNGCFRLTVSKLAMPQRALCGKPQKHGFRTMHHSVMVCRIVFRAKLALFEHSEIVNVKHMFYVSKFHCVNEYPDAGVKAHRFCRTFLHTRYAKYLTSETIKADICENAF